MAAINLRPINPSDKDRVFDFIGDGAIAGTDVICTAVNTYPVGTTYLDKTNRILYIRTAAAGVVGDWIKSPAAMTVHT